MNVVLTQKTVGQLEVLLNMLLLHRRDTFPLLPTSRYRQQLYQANIPAELLEMIEESYFWKPKLFLPRLFDGRVIAALHSDEHGYGEPEPGEQDAAEGRRHILVFAQIALNRGITLPPHLPEPIHATAELIKSLSDDGFAFTGEGIVPVISDISAVPVPELAITSASVELALKNAETSIRNDGAKSAVDRAHTAFHGYLRAVCQKEGIQVGGDASILQLLKAIRASHPKLATTVPGGDEVNKIIRNLSATVDTFNPIRNSKSLAHPTNTLLEEPEAMLVINITRTLLHYLDKRLS